MVLNFDDGLIQWMTRDSKGTKLHQASLRGSSVGQDGRTTAPKDSHSHVHLPQYHASGNLQLITISDEYQLFQYVFFSIGPLSYFNGKLIWLENEHTAVVADVSVKYRSRMHVQPKAGGEFGSIINFAVYHASSHPLPGKCIIFSFLKGPVTSGSFGLMLWNFTKHSVCAQPETNWFYRSLVMAWKMRQTEDPSNGNLVHEAHIRSSLWGFTVARILRGILSYNHVFIFGN